VKLKYCCTLVAERLSKWGGTNGNPKKYRKFLWFELTTVTSQALKYDVTSFCPYV